MRAMGFILAAALTLATTARAAETPLVTLPDGMGIGSPTDRLADVTAMCGMVKVDGRTYRFLGPATPGRADVTEMKQTSLRVTPTRTVAAFAGDGFVLTVNFTSPLLPDEPEVLARRAAYVTLTLRATDRKPHPAWVYFDVAGELATGSDEETVTSAHDPPGVLHIAGLNRGLYVLLDPSRGFAPQIGPADEMRAKFVNANEGVLSDKRLGGFNGAAMDGERRIADGRPVIAFAQSQGVFDHQPRSTHLIIALDAANRRSGGVVERLRDAEREYQRVMQACLEFDERVGPEPEKALAHRWKFGSTPTTRPARAR